MKSVEELDVFKLSHEMALSIYELKKLPRRRKIRPHITNAQSGIFGGNESS